MKIIACADLHITNKRPKSRKDDYYQTALRKFKDILEMAHGSVLVIAGDFFDKHNVPYQVTRDIVDILLDHVGPILVVPGQHDLRYHVKGLSNTPLGILEAAGLVTILRSDKIEIVDGVSFVGAGWDDFPDKDENCNVMVAHRMVTLNGPLFPGHEDYTTAGEFLKEYPGIDIIISGDNHKPHVWDNMSGQVQVNCGSMLRKSKDQIDFKPRVFEIRTGERTVAPIYLDIEKDVFNMDEIEREEERDLIRQEAEESIQKFIGSLNVDDSEKPNFENVLRKVIQKVKPKKTVVQVIDEIMEEVND
jgi:DNA repair exonuclease SbcCD nuclease subunit